MNDKNSLEEVKQLREQIMKLKETRKVPFVICANKCVIMLVDKGLAI
jgi:GTPase KRas protein